MFRKFIEFLRTDIWHVHFDTISKWQAFWIRFFRVAILTSQGFTKSQIQQGASSLSYYTLLAIVPVIALFIGIARGFLFEQTFERWLITQFSDQKEMLMHIFELANESLRTANQGVIAGIGLILLLWSGIKILMNIEIVFNQIWEVRRTRSYARMFSDYLAMILIAPIIIFSASALTVYLSSTLTTLEQGTKAYEQIGHVLFPLLNLFPIFLTSLLLTFLYIFMPNTQVRFFPALIAGLITGITYQIVQWIYLAFQIGVSSYNAIYGTFAAIPLFLIWIQLSWVIILLGAKIAFSIQNVDAYEFISEDFHLCQRIKNVLLLRISHFAIIKFCKGELPPNVMEISDSLSIPISLTKHLIFQLTDSGILSQVKRDEDQYDGYQPARSVDCLTIKYILDMLNERGGKIPIPPSRELKRIVDSLEQFSLAIESSGGNILLKDI